MTLLKNLQKDKEGMEVKKSRNFLLLWKYKGNDMLKIVLGTGNEHKIHEMNLISKPFGVEFYTAFEKSDFNPDETGATFEENAYIKAFSAYQLSCDSVLNKSKLNADNGIQIQKTEENSETEISSKNAPKLFLADDSGLCVDFLDGGPGIKSARYADTAEHRIEKLLEAMKDAKNRTAHFECHLVLLDEKGEILHKTAGICKGKIALEKKGTGGFGYDPVFILDKLGKTMAELSEDEKNLHSHRGKALMDMLIWLKYRYK